MADKYTLAEVRVEQLQFDPSNPRLPPDVNGTDDSAVLEWMLAGSGLLELMASMAAQGYFPGDPLLISPVEEAGDTPKYDEGAEYVVVEGNRRLAALRLLRGDVKAPKRRKSVEARITEAKDHNFTVVPAVLFAHRSEVLDYLGFRHITGVKQWDPLEKARFLFQLREREGGSKASNADLAKTIGSNAPYVGRLLVALALLELLAKSPDLKKAGVRIDDVWFSLLVAALNRTSIVSFLGLEAADDPELPGLKKKALNSLGRWLFVPRKDGRTALRESRNLSLLGEVVQSKKAIAALDSGASIREAALIAHSPEDVLATALNEARAPLVAAERQLPDLDDAADDLVAASSEIKDLATEIEAEVRRIASND